MTTLFDQLQKIPQTDFNIGDLNYDERAQIRRIRIQGGNSWGEGKAFNSVLYLEGDEQQAAEVFVDANCEELQDIDLSGQNILQARLDREIYDWILHHLGKRTITKYETVVEESRPDGTTWIIDRDRYDTQPSRRYGIGEAGVVELSDHSPREGFDSFGPIISRSGIADHDHVTTSTPVTLLEYYCVAPEYAVEAIEISRKRGAASQSEPAVRKLSEESDEP